MYTYYPMWLFRYWYSTRKQSTYSWARDVLILQTSPIILYQGSGKTLAFGIPIITHILHQRAVQETDRENENEEKVDISETSSAEAGNSMDSDKKKRPLLALIMTPTRELALQIKSHLQQVAKHTFLEVWMFPFSFLSEWMFPVCWLLVSSVGRAPVC